METLELKHLAPYLPYRLKYFSPKRDMTPFLGNSKDETIEAMGPVSMMSILQSGGHLKPLLRPLSGFTKEIEHNGERFRPIEILLQGNNFDTEKMTVKEINGYAKTFEPAFVCFFDGLKLCEWHFDIFGLIEKGLAMDMNQIETYAT